MQETVIVEKDLSPGVHVRVEGVPAVFRGSGTERRHYFNVKTSKRLEELLAIARQLMLEGETDIRLAYDGRYPEDLVIEHQATLRLSEFTICAKCRVPPFDASRVNDIPKLWAWIAEWDKELLASIHSELQQKPGTLMSDWYAALPVTLRTEVVNRIERSTLQIDHGIPTKVANELSTLFTIAERRFLRETLLFMLCKQCANKSGKLIPKEDLKRMYVETFYDSTTAAIADRSRWTLFNSVVEKTYEQRSLGIVK